MLAPIGTTGTLWMLEGRAPSGQFRVEEAPTLANDEKIGA